jgi:hypothetical protein
LILFVFGVLVFGQAHWIEQQLVQRYPDLALDFTQLKSFVQRGQLPLVVNVLVEFALCISLGPHGQLDGLLKY